MASLLLFAFGDESIARVLITRRCTAQSRHANRRLTSSPNVAAASRTDPGSRFAGLAFAEETERKEESLREDAPSHRRSPGNSYVSAIAETYPAIAAPSEDDTEKALLNNDSAKGSRSETGSAYGTQAPSAEAEQPDVVRK